jgi:hypothetical protein
MLPLRGGTSQSACASMEKPRLLPVHHCKEKQSMPYDAQVPVKTPAKFAVSLADSRPDANAVQEIANAIAALDLGTGITFDPFILLCAAGGFNNVWNSERGDIPITFYQSNGANAPFLPLGDVAVINNTLAAGTPLPGTQILFAPSDDPSVLANPVGFSLILDDSGSGNDRDVAYFAMNPPEGYVALGIAFNGSDDAPNPANYWCVRSDLVRAVGSYGVWSDSGQGWDNDGSLSAPVAGLQVPEPSMLFAPPTLLSNQGGTAPYALLMQQADLQVEPLDPGMPVYDPTITNGDVTTYGLTAVKIVPYSVVADPGLLNQSAVSPFYFVAAEQYYLCTTVLPTPAGGSFEVTQTVGTSQSDSATFTTETSMTVSADLGVAYGPASLNISASYTHSFGTSVTHTADHQSEVQTQVTINLPAQPRTWIWERQTQISVFRTDTSQLVPVTYSEPDLILIPS